MFCFHGGTQDIPSFVFGQVDTINGGREELWGTADYNELSLVFPHISAPKAVGKSSGLTKV